MPKCSSLNADRKLRLRNGMRAATQILRRAIAALLAFFSAEYYATTAAMIERRGSAHDARGPPSVLLGEADKIMIQRDTGTCVGEILGPLRWGADTREAQNICCFNRHYAERRGSWVTSSFLREQRGKVTTFYDSVTGKPLFRAPLGRTWQEFEKESREHGWPSFRDAEVISDSTRVLEDGEVVSEDGTHLGHNLPDSRGNRYCINLVSVAGIETAEEGEEGSEKQDYLL